MSKTRGFICFLLSPLLLGMLIYGAYLDWKGELSHYE